MGIWYDLYGTRSKEFIEGAIAGVEMYATWKGGMHTVGASEQPLLEVIKQIRTDLEGGPET
jgi:hypothetical protein